MIVVQLKGPPTGTFDKELPCGWKSHGAAGAIYGRGVPLVKIFWTGRVISGIICRQIATIDRKDSNIKVLGVNRDDILAAAERIASEVQRTPLIESEVAGERVWLKCECLQTGGAFKLRGATNRLLHLSRKKARRAAVAFSSGN